MCYYSDVVMGAMASQITGVSIVYSESTVCSDAYQRKHQSSASLAFVRRIHRWPVNYLHKGPVTHKMLPFDDVIIFLIGRLANFLRGAYVGVTCLQTECSPPTTFGSSGAVWSTGWAGFKRAITVSMWGIRGFMIDFLLKVTVSQKWQDLAVCSRCVIRQGSRLIWLVGTGGQFQTSKNLGLERESC